jgi:hypothetical protein
MSRKLRRIAAFLPRHAAFAALSPMERRLLAAAPADGPTPVFMLGLPRSGTTLAVDLLVSRYRMAYFSTLANRLWRVPAAATRLGARMIRDYQGKFESSYGHIPAWGAPNEGGEVWNSWYDESKALTEADVPRVDAERIRRTIWSVTHSLGGSFISKNVMHGLHMRFLDALFPGCLFVEIRRAQHEVARSLLRARRDFGGEAGMREWISIRPPGHERYLDADPVTQVCAQIVLTQEHIRRDARAFGPTRHFVIDYAHLCASPREVLDGFEAFYFAGTGNELERRESELPDLSRSPGKPVNSEQERQILAELERLTTLHGEAA